MMDMMDDVTGAGTRPGLWPNMDMVGVRARAHEFHIIGIRELVHRV